MDQIPLPDAQARELFRSLGIGLEENGKIKVHILEALYLVEKGKLALQGETFQSLMEKAKREDPLAESKYLVFKSLRSRGYIVRLSFGGEEWMRIYRKGFRPGEDRTHYLLKVVPSDWTPALGELLSDMKKAADVRKELVYACATEGQPFFFKTARTSFE